ncbi:MAG: divalent cation tolerance protein CutA [Roseibacillus sp.]|nr:divalent cation tolerance protein CutA [Roseibacillus sp.]
MRADVQVVLCRFPDLPQARQIGTALVEMQLGAYVNLIPAVESIFRWEGKVSTEEEVFAVFKTTAEQPRGA